MKPKVLVIRFNSIGDIVLTTPVIELLSKKFDVYYLTKASYKSLLVCNPNVKGLFLFENDLNKTISDLLIYKFDYVVDLHNNFRSFSVRRKIKAKSFTFKKPRIKYWLRTTLGIKLRQQPHIVERFTDVIKPIIAEKTLPPTRFYFDQNMKFEFSLPENYTCIAVGTAFYTKTIPTYKWVEILNSIDGNIVLLGGSEDVKNSQEIASQLKRNVVNLTGTLTLSESAYVIDKSKVLITGDTGLKHIAAALNKRVVAIYGSTHPILGYTPYYGPNKNLSQIIKPDDLACSPCTKQGRKSCPKGHFKCMNDIPVEKIIKLISN